MPSTSNNQSTNLRLKTILPLLVVFIALTVIILAFKIFYTAPGMDYAIVMAGNCLFFVVSLFVFRMQYLAMYHPNPQVFIRSVMGGMLIKVFVCIIAVVGYYLISRPAFNKPAVYASMLIYVLYLVVEVRTIMKLNKSKNA